MPTKRRLTIATAALASVAGVVATTAIGLSASADTTPTAEQAVAQVAATDGGGQDASGDTRIIGGRRVNSEYTVQIRSRLQGQDWYCTGNALSPEWILTAKHCVRGITSSNIYYSNSTYSPGPAYRADRWYMSPNGDVGLIHVRGKSLKEYSPITQSTMPAPGKGEIAGYGGRANMGRPSGLFGANVNVLSEGRDLFGGPAWRVQGVDGAANHGDSGGPLMVNGEVVGVCSNGDDNDPGSNTRAISYYAAIATSRDWIKSTSGM